MSAQYGPYTKLRFVVFSHRPHVFFNIFLCIESSYETHPRIVEMTTVSYMGFIKASNINLTGLTHDTGGGIKPLDLIFFPHFYLSKIFIFTNHHFYLTFQTSIVISPSKTSIFIIPNSHHKIAPKCCKWKN